MKLNDNGFINVVVIVITYSKLGCSYVVIHNT